jgi:hypothetical protein
MPGGLAGADRARPPVSGRHPCGRWITSRPAHVAAVLGQFPGVGLTSQARGAEQARAFSIFPAARPGMCRTCRLLAGRDTGALAAGRVHVDL